MTESVDQVMVMVMQEYGKFKILKQVVCMEVLPMVVLSSKLWNVLEIRDGNSCFLTEVGVFSWEQATVLYAVQLESGVED